MSLAARQAEFMAHVLEEGRALPDGWDARFSAGLDIYRNAYRTRLVDAMRETFPRTAQWVGEESFAAAAAHHLITNPPSVWTLDLVGEGFPDLLAELFVRDPDVPELAWLEWTMHLAFIAADVAPLDREGFMAAVAGFGEDDWPSMALAFTPSLAWAEVKHDIPRLWNGLKQETEKPECPALDQPATLAVWREGLQPVFRLLDPAVASLLATMQGGTAYGDACAMLAELVGEEAAAQAAGAALGQWITDGLVVAVRA
ncbi:MAG: putative DNA-binding domain-containing protein [Sphingomonadaceae bacterium]|nr:putative DNA-binding domain-containing protein [Sphingomonadaceae bacterium]